MVNIDTVYQRVLILANKEQRGYITPQEFNLYANNAQIEIFEQYFYDTNQFARVPGNEFVYADVDDMLEEKLQIFQAEITGLSNGSTIPSSVYRVYKIEGQGGTDYEILKTSDFSNLINAPYLIRPTAARPVANIRGNTLYLNPPSLSSTSLFHFRKPNKVSWGYFVLRQKALHDSDPLKTQHFELHPSEETELVYKILKLAGLGTKRDDVAKGGQGLESLQIQQEKQ